MHLALKSQGRTVRVNVSETIKNYTHTHSGSFDSKFASEPHTRKFRSIRSIAFCVSGIFGVCL